MIFMEKELLELSIKRVTIIYKKEFRIKKYLREKVTIYVLDRKVIIIILIVGLIKKDMVI